MKIVIVGSGFMGKMHASVYRALPSIELGVISRRPESGQDFASRFGADAFESIEEALAWGAEIIDLCSPTSEHPVAAREAFRGGAHVISEKPVALTVKDADLMIEDAESNGKRLFVAHCIRYWPEYRRLKLLIDNGQFGRIQSLSLQRCATFPSWSTGGWLGDSSQSGGGVLDMLIHDFDFLRWALGEPTEFAAFGLGRRSSTNSIVCSLRFGKVIAQVEGGWNLPPTSPFKMAFRACFEHGAAVMDGGPLTLYPESGDPEIPEFEEMKAAGGGNIEDLGGYYHCLKDFVECVQEGRDSAISTARSARDSLALTLRVIEAAGD